MEVILTTYIHWDPILQVVGPFKHGSDRPVGDFLDSLVVHVDTLLPMDWFYVALIFQFPIYLEPGVQLPNILATGNLVPNI